MTGQLSDENLVRFLDQGYLVLSPTAMDDNAHDHLYSCACALYAKAGALQAGTSTTTNHLQLLGDNLPGLVPGLRGVLEDPRVTDTLAAILGDNYLLHPHSFCHRSSDADQPFHQDGNLPWNERGHYRAHRPDWALLFYYPQAVTMDLGPTELVAGTQYWTTNIEKPDGTWHAGDPVDREMDRAKLAADDLDRRDVLITQGLDHLGVPGLKREFVLVPKGSVVIAHYDIVHRGSRSMVNQPERFMYKFYFARTREPLPPAGSAELVNLPVSRPELEPVINEIYQWLGGKSAERPDAGRDLRSATSEADRIAVAYELGASARAGSSTALRGLVSALSSEAEAERRAAGYGLRISGPDAVPHLVQNLSDGPTGTRRYAAFALGNAANAHGPAAEALTRALGGDPDDLVRSNAAYALGHLLRTPGTNTPEIVEVLLKHVASGFEPVNTRAGGMLRSTVRESVAYALVQGAENGALTTGHVDQLLRTTVFHDDDRYVQGLLADALTRVPALTPGQTRQLIAGLNLRRHFVEPLATP